MNAHAPIAAVDTPDYAGLTVTPVSTVLGAEISGLDLREPLTPEVVAAIRTALLRHKVVFFRDQDISHADHVRFGRYFGDLEGHPVTSHVPGFPEILHIEAADGMKLREEIVPLVRVANKWHTDVTFRAAPSMGGVLRMRDMPPLGGDTLFADTAAIYRDLPQALKDKLADLTAEHDIIQSYGYRVDQAKRDELRAAYPLMVHPVIRTHPETGDKHLFVNKVFTTRILGLPEDEARTLLAELLDRVKTPEYQVRFRWTPNAIVFWDNRATQHYAILDYWPQERIVERVTIVGDAPY
ncbi:TauD/TfdA dioxygenase family protein [Caulobacter sp. ErkDOM-E]|jgi:taurine dioxygenase|uniref:TauD/TfdA dioxygenase family protein n=1 Tax=Caulobacter sp. ErkDOM-E TaxID=3402778 RepID=UPI003AF81F6C